MSSISHTDRQTRTYIYIWNLQHFTYIYVYYIHTNCARHAHVCMCGRTYTHSIQDVCEGLTFLSRTLRLNFFPVKVMPLILGLQVDHNYICPTTISIISGIVIGSISIHYTLSLYIWSQNPTTPTMTKCNINRAFQPLKVTQATRETVRVYASSLLHE